MYKAISICGPGTGFAQIGEVIEDYAKEHGYCVNKEFGGHGIAHELHLTPQILHYRILL